MALTVFGRVRFVLDRGAFDNGSANNVTVLAGSKYSVNVSGG